jgi:predicted acylesterase/phospholipase RssA
VLSFDGGGYRGYASLLILRNILRRMEPEPTPVFPYLYFDLICGTSTGGLIAILLGVLYLDIDTAIRVYAALGKTVFGTHWTKLRYVVQDEQFNRSRLRRVVTHILETHGNGRALMEDSTLDRGCKVR